MSRRHSSYTFHPKGGGRRIKIALALVACLLGTLLIVAVNGWRDIYTKVIETTPPTIQVTKLPRGIGLSPTSLHIEIVDSGSGIGSIEVFQAQGGKTDTLLELKPEGKKKESIAVEFVDAERNLKDGDVEVTVTATDRSFWRQSSTVSLNLLADFSRPTIEMIIAPSEIKYGQTGLVFYEVDDRHTVTTGITIDGTTFPGYSARLFDKDLSLKGLTVAPFTIPLSSQPDQSQAFLFAEDTVGNTTSLPITISALDRTRQKRERLIPPQQLGQKVSPALRSNANTLREYPSEKVSALMSRNTLPDPISQFRLFYGPLRELDELKIRTLMSEVKLDRYWTSPFVRQAGQILEDYGAILDLRHDGEIIGELEMNGCDITLDKLNHRVIAVASGFVIFIGTLPTLGKTVIIDHGLGLFSLYANLSTVRVPQAKLVARGDVVGEIDKNQSPPYFHFEVRLAGEPVDPLDWWRAESFQKNIHDPTNEIKRKLAIPIRLPL